MRATMTPNSMGLVEMHQGVSVIVLQARKVMQSWWAGEGLGLSGRSVARAADCRGVNMCGQSHCLLECDCEEETVVSPT